MTNAGNIASAVVAARGFDRDIRRGGRRRIARRVIEAMIDEALDRAGAWSDQRARIYGARNRAFAAIDDYLEGEDAAACPLVEAELREQVQRRFVLAPIDAAPRDTRRARPNRQLLEILAESVQQAHALLTPPQREVVAGYVRAHLHGAS